MSNSVLCAVDITSPTDDVPVLQMAKRLADMDGAQLDVITVIPDFGMSVVGSFFKEGHHEHAQQEATTRLKALSLTALGAEADETVRHVVATGSAYEEILKTAKVTDCKLIVLGAHKPDFKDYLLGPNAARVVRHANCSVHIVREG